MPFPRVCSALLLQHGRGLLRQPVRGSSPAASRPGPARGSLSPRSPRGLAAAFPPGQARLPGLPGFSPWKPHVLQPRGSGGVPRWGSPSRLAAPVGLWFRVPRVPHCVGAEQSLRLNTVIAVGQERDGRGIIPC